MKKIICLLAAILLLATMTSCANQPDTDKINSSSVVVGFSQLGAESSWRIANTESMEKAAKEAGFGLMMENANQKQEKQIDAIRSFIAYQVDVIVFSPIVESGWDNILNEASNAGIPVILMDRMISNSDDNLYTTYVGADFYAEGRRAGEYLIRKADTMNKETFNIFEICGTVDSTPMRERQQGFMDAIGDDPRFNVVDSICGDFLRSMGGECAELLLEKYGENMIDVIYSHNDSMTLGVLDVLEQRGIRPGKDIVLITVDGEKEAVNALKAGKINCVVQCTPDLGPAVMELVRKLKAGEQVSKITHPEEGIFCDFDDLSNPAVEGF